MMISFSQILNIFSFLLLIMKKAVVFDNSGTLIERFRVIKDVINGNIFTDINSLDLIDQADALALVVLQFNTNKLLKLDPDTLISDVIKEYNIDFDVSFSTNQVSKAEVKEILDNEKSTMRADPLQSSIWEIFSRKMSKPSVMSDIVVDFSLSRISLTSALET